ncbi:MAG TPA: DUF1499 domain-containing protein [Rhizomicrobium sp.]|nr:DUF1499 domain-containing protein [Rhizomicrobium sp.]
MRFLRAAGATSFATFLIALAIGLTAAFGSRFGYWDYRTGLDKIFPFSLGLGAVAFVSGLAWLATALAANVATAIRLGLTGFLGSLIVLGVPINSYLQSLGKPPIHDISTDVEHPPQFVALLLQREGAGNPPDYDGPAHVAMDSKTFTVRQLQKKYYEDIHTLGQLEPPERLFDRALSAAKSMGWNIVAVVPDEGRIEATYTTFFFGFVSDIVIRVQPSGMGARLDIRAKSRVGDADGGINAQLIRSYVKTLNNS